MTENINAIRHKSQSETKPKGYCDNSHSYHSSSGWHPVSFRDKAERLLRHSSVTMVPDPVGNVSHSETKPKGYCDLPDNLTVCDDIAGQSHSETKPKGYCDSCQMHVTPSGMTTVSFRDKAERLLRHLGIMFLSVDEHRLSQRQSRKAIATGIQHRNQPFG